MKKIIDVKSCGKPIFLCDDACESYVEHHERPNDLIVEEVDF